MIIGIGHYSLILLAIINLLIFLKFFTNNLIIRRRYLINIISLELILITIVISSLLYTYIISDFTVLNIKNHSHITMPLLYKITGLWGNHEGSILLWCFIIILNTFVISVIGNDIKTNILYKYLFIQNIFSFFFIIFTLLTSNPFIYTYIYNLNGSELNPILQDAALAIHPPLIYIGYIGSSINYSLSIIILVENNFHDILKKYITINTLVTWSFLTVGILLGSWWSYYELGWGGWWFWDPVENGVLMPWILLTIILHCVKRESLKNWVIILNLLTFIFSLLGTFFVRSGILVSVHSFAVDSYRGFFIFSFLLIIMVMSIVIYFLNSKKLFSNTYYTYKTIDNLIIINNIILLIILFTIFIGTILPSIFSLFFNKSIFIGASFFNKTLTPIIIPLLILISINTFLKKTFSIYLKTHQFSFGNIIVILSIILIYKVNITYVSLILIILLSWLFTSLIKYIYEYRYINSMIIAHLGVFIFFIGVVISNLFQIESIQIMLPGDEIILTNHIFNLRNINYILGSNYYSIYGNVAVINKGDYINILFPEKRYYFIKGIYITKSVIYSNYFADIYAIIGDGNINNGWYTKYYYRPLMSFIWLGPLFFIFGAIFFIYNYINKFKYVNWY